MSVVYVKSDLMIIIFALLEQLARSYAQCARLYNCIQAAVVGMVDTEKSKDWAARRVKLLLDLIPHTQLSPPLGIPIGCLLCYNFVPLINHARPVVGTCKHEVIVFLLVQTSVLSLEL